MSGYESAYDKHWKRLAELLGPEEAAAERARMTADERADRHRAKLAKFKKELPTLRKFLAEAEKEGRHEYTAKLRKQIAYREGMLAAPSPQATPKGDIERQLADAERQLTNAARLIWRRGERWADLYDVSAAKPKRAMTEAQRAALEKARQAQCTCPHCKTVFSFVLPWRFDCPVCFDRQLAADRAKAARQARLWLRSTRTVILDTETTDLDGYLVQIAVIRATDGAVLLDTLVNPQHPISASARAVHHITDEQLAGAPTFAQIADELVLLLRGRRIIIYNVGFDLAVLQREVMRKHDYGWRQAIDFWGRGYRFGCAMELYAQFCGDWSDHHGNYRWQPLPGGDHSALGDARACREVLEWMAERPTIESELHKEEEPKP